MKKKKNKKSKGFFKKYFLVAAFYIALIFIILFTYVMFALPDVQQLRERATQPLIKLFDNDSDLIHTYGDYDSNYVSYHQFPQHLIDAVIAIEDRRFFEHHGIDFLSIPRAILENIIAMSYVQGASTISQQLSKMLFLTADKNLLRKIKEALLALKIEWYFSKAEILEMYLNKAYFGSGNYGIVAAAQGYFDKKVNDLSVHEAALLAGLLKAPSKYSPKVNPQLSKLRTDIVLSKMLENNFINATDVTIIEYQDNLWQKNSNILSDNYKYFGDWVNSEVNNYVEVFPFDLRVNTSFDKRVNDIVNKVIFDFYKANSELQKTQISLVAMRLDGAVLSVIGGYNYKKSQFNRALYGKRQSGSAFKLFVYLEALLKGYKSDDKVVDKPVSIAGWEPKNYDEKYHGVMTLREAFVRSINSVAASLAHEIGVDNIIDLAHQMGIKSDIPQVPSISLGTSDVSLFELVNAYMVIANQGYKVEPYNIVNITDNYGNVMFEKEKTAPLKILDDKVALQMSNLLHGVVVWGTGKAANVEGLHIRGKTGTTQNYRDAWFIGFTDDIIIGVWIGQEQQEVESRISGGKYPAQIFAKIIKEIYK